MKAYYKNTLTGEIRIYDPDFDSIPAVYVFEDVLPSVQGVPLDTSLVVVPAGGDGGHIPTFKVEKTVVLWIPYFIALLIIFALVVWRS